MSHEFHISEREKCRGLAMTTKLYFDGYTEEEISRIIDHPEYRVRRWCQIAKIAKRDLAEIMNE